MEKQNGSLTNNGQDLITPSLSQIPVSDIKNNSEEQKKGRYNDTGRERTNVVHQASSNIQHSFASSNNGLDDDLYTKVKKIKNLDEDLELKIAYATAEIGNDADLYQGTRRIYNTAEATLGLLTAQANTVYANDAWEAFATREDGSMERVSDILDATIGGRVDFDEYFNDQTAANFLQQTGTVASYRDAQQNIDVDVMFQDQLTISPDFSGSETDFLRALESGDIMKYFMSDILNTQGLSLSDMKIVSAEHNSDAAHIIGLRKRSDGTSTIENLQDFNRAFLETHQKRLKNDGAKAAASAQQEYIRALNDLSVLTTIQLRDEKGNVRKQQDIYYGAKLDTKSHRSDSLARSVYSSAGGDFKVDVAVRNESGTIFKDAERHYVFNSGNVTNFHGGRANNAINNNRRMRNMPLAAREKTDAYEKAMYQTSINMSDMAFHYQSTEKGSVSKHRDALRQEREQILEYFGAMGVHDTNALRRMEGRRYHLQNNYQQIRDPLVRELKRAGVDINDPNTRIMIDEFIRNLTVDQKLREAQQSGQRSKNAVTMFASQIVSDAELVQGAQKIAMVANTTQLAAKMSWSASSLAAQGITTAGDVAATMVQGGGYLLGNVASVVNHDVGKKIKAGSTAIGKSGRSAASSTRTAIKNLERKPSEWRANQIQRRANLRGEIKNRARAATLKRIQNTRLGKAGSRVANSWAGKALGAVSSSIKNFFAKILKKISGISLFLKKAGIIAILLYMISGPVLAIFQCIIQIPAAQINALVGVVTGLSPNDEIGDLTQKSTYVGNVADKLYRKMQRHDFTCWDSDYRDGSWSKITPNGHDIYVNDTTLSYQLLLVYKGILHSGDANTDAVSEDDDADVTDSDTARPLLCPYLSDRRKQIKSLFGKNGKTCHLFKLVEVEPYGKGNFIPDPDDPLNTESVHPQHYIQEKFIGYETYKDTDGDGVDDTGENPIIKKSFISLTFRQWFLQNRSWLVDNNPHTIRDAMGSGKDIDDEFNMLIEMVQEDAYRQYFTCGVSTVNVAALGGANMDVIWNFLINDANGPKLSEEGAAGVIGNLICESGLSENSESAAGYIGIAQWGSGRRDNLESLAQENGTTWNDLGTQLQFLTSELMSGYGFCYNYLKTGGNASTRAVNYPGVWNSDSKLNEVGMCAEVFCVEFEGCIGSTGNAVNDGIVRLQDADNTHSAYGCTYQGLQKRIDTAMDVYNYYHNMGGTMDSAQIESIIAMSDAQGMAADALRYAFSHMGATYSQAYRMQEGYYDCSSLAARSWASAGYDYGGGWAPTAAETLRIMDDQGFGHNFSTLNECKPGDLLFWAGSGNGRYKNITHVAIYAGGGRMVEASSSKGQVVYREVWGTPLAYASMPN